MKTEKKTKSLTLLPTSAGEQLATTDLLRLLDKAGDGLERLSGCASVSAKKVAL
jgi:hypothetical protein